MTEAKSGQSKADAAAARAAKKAAEEADEAASSAKFVTREVKAKYQEVRVTSSVKDQKM